jgi:hypothetical protein
MSSLSSMTRHSFPHPHSTFRRTVWEDAISARNCRNNSGLHQHDLWQLLWTVEDNMLIPNETWIENIAVRANGNLHVTLITSPEVWTIDPCSGDAKLIHRVDQGYICVWYC